MFIKNLKDLNPIEEERLKQKVKEGDKKEKAKAYKQLRELKEISETKIDKRSKIEEQLLTEFCIVI